MILNSVKNLLLSDKAAQLHSRLERELLLAHVLGISRAALYLEPMRVILDSQKQQFEDLVKRRLEGEPLAYLVGYQEFWSLPLKVSNAVLIPRPETELLVELALSAIQQTHGVRVLDLGTGSGAIALALGAERKDWEIVAIDRSEPALAIAIENAKKLAIQNVHFYQSDWFSCMQTIAKSLRARRLAERQSRVSVLKTPEATENLFDIIISNPPYIKLDDIHLSPAVRQYEPTEALICPPDGLGDLDFIIAEAPRYLAPKGRLILEHGFDQGEHVKRSMERRGFVEVQGFKDLAGLPRVVIGRKE